MPYGSSNQCTIKDKEMLVEKKSNCRYEKGQFCLDSLRKAAGENKMTATQVWGKGMEVRRLWSIWVAEFGKIIKYSVLKPKIT